MVYFDNSATGGFKPNIVYETANTVIKYLSANPGRSGHRLSTCGAERVYECRNTLANFFNCQPEKVIFTKNCTEALNSAIFGLVKKGGHIITTVFEHNSVLRPLYYLKSENLIELTIVKPDGVNSIAGIMQQAIKKNTYMIVSTAVSNVTGESLPLNEIGNLCKQKNLFFIVDGAQGGGHIEIDMQKNNISCLCLAGHKGLYGIMGSGALLIADNTSVSPFMLGGTGIDTLNENMPENYPERLESGTLNLPAICALNEGAIYVKHNLKVFNSVLNEYTNKIIEGLEKINGIKLYSKANGSGIVSFEFNKIPSNQLADILNSEYDIAVRGGLHCAPLMHKFLKTEKNGLVRVSLAPQNTHSEINYFISSMKKICAKFS